MVDKVLDPSQFRTVPELVEAFVGFARSTCGVSRSNARLMRRELTHAVEGAMAETGAALSQLRLGMESHSWGHARWVLFVPNREARALH